MKIVFLQRQSHLSRAEELTTTEGVTGHCILKSLYKGTAVYHDEKHSDASSRYDESLKGIC